PPRRPLPNRARRHGRRQEHARRRRELELLIINSDCMEVIFIHSLHDC
uniref:Uncharacterized protein n=1 Tax=Aegilops tauschii subsp. strangulata TaxID=200361 RepID=A0A453M8F3_AEGTS